MRKNGICCTQTKKLELDKENQCYLHTSKRAQAQWEQYFLQIQTELELDEKKQVFLTLKQKIELNEEKKAVFIVQTNKNLSFTRKKKQHFLCKQTETWASKGGEKHHFLCTDKNFRLMRKNIFHKDREISISHNEEENSKVKTSSGSHKKNQTRGDKITNKIWKTHTSMNKSASLTPVQGPSTVVCMIVT